MKAGIVSVMVAVVVLGASIGFMNWRAQNADERMVTETTAGEQTTEKGISIQEEQADIQYNEIETSAQDTLTVQSSAVQATYPAYTDNGALVIGSEEAPVTITEYSSLSCSHCATFHSDVLPSLKKDYVDTGIAKIVFHDFPTNTEAMDASKLLKCVDIKERYDFMNLLFEQQLQWALPSVDHRQKLMQYAALLGVSSEKAAACMDDKDVENEIIQGLQQANSKYGVDSTPTFVLAPGDKILIGARPYGDFSSEIEALVKQGE